MKPHTYLVTFYFRFGKLARVVRADSTSEAIKKVGRQVFDLGLQYEAVIAEAV